MGKRKYSKKEIDNMKRIAECLIDLNKQKLKLNKYEYYMLGGIPFKEAASAIYHMHAQKLINQIEYNVLHNYIDEQLTFITTKNKEFILNTHYQFGDTVISLDEKINIWNNLLSMGISEKEIDDLLFSAAVREYAKDNGLIANVKKKVYIPSKNN